MSDSIEMELLQDEDNEILDKTPTEKALDEVKKTMQVIDAPETAHPSIKFALFNFFHSNPDYKIEELDREISKLSELARKEKEFRDCSKIPTIGVEVEFSRDLAEENQEILDVMYEIGVENGEELSHKHLWELRPSPSYSSSAQSRIIEESKKVGLVRFGHKDNLSMHINLGAPDFLRESDTTNIYSNSDSFAFANASTIAFASTKRLNERKTTAIYVLKTDSVRMLNRKPMFRFEIRTEELEDKVAYRALDEIQLISSSFFSSLKIDSTDEIDSRLSEIWRDFELEFYSVVNKYDLPQDELDSCDPDYEKIIPILDQNPEIQKEVRLIFSKYAREVKSLLFG